MGIRAAVGREQAGLEHVSAASWRAPPAGCSMSLPTVNASTGPANRMMKSLRLRYPAVMPLASVPGRIVHLDM